MSKLLVPSPDNRQACIENLWDKCALSPEPWPGAEQSYAWLDDALRHGRLPQVCGGLVTIASRDLDRSIACRWHGRLDESKELARKSFAYTRLARELDGVLRASGRYEDASGDEAIHQLLAQQAFAAVGGLDCFSVWVAPHLRDLLAHPDAGNGYPLIHLSWDKPAIQFFLWLQLVLLDRVVHPLSIVGDLGGYRVLLEGVVGVNDWKQALIRYCDWRLANAFGYEYMGAAKRRRQSQQRNVLDAEGWEQILPYELFTLTFAIRRASAVDLSLDVDHPLLNGRLFEAPFPRLDEEYVDESLANVGLALGSLDV